MTDRAKPSGPLWALYNPDGTQNSESYATRETPERLAYIRRDTFPGCTAGPCRILPGHGKWVPGELVEAIEAQWNSSLNISDEWVDRVRAAIRAAREGGV
jgi:hypothetical protein